MSTTIGFGFSQHSDLDFCSEAQALAETCGYGLAIGIEAAESDVKRGIGMAQRLQGWKDVALLRSPKNGVANTAFEIDEELTAMETHGCHPRFFEFLESLAALAGGKASKLGVFFASEWEAQDKIRMSYGRIDDLKSLLSMPGNWCVRYLLPETGRMQDSDEVPLLFDVKLS